MPRFRSCVISLVPRLSLGGGVRGAESGGRSLGGGVWGAESGGRSLRHRVWEAEFGAVWEAESWGGRSLGGAAINRDRARGGTSEKPRPPRRSAGTSGSLTPPPPVDWGRRGRSSSNVTWAVPVATGMCERRPATETSQAERTLNSATATRRRHDSTGFNWI